MSGRTEAHYKSKIAYDGTAYRGFQRQAEGIATIQATLEAALRQVGWQGRSLLAAGRTDAGVHARGQVIGYQLAWNHTTVDLTAALNANLPADIAVWGTTEVAAGFHPRFEARARRYVYTLFGQPHRDPLRERYAWRQWPAPSLSAMQPVVVGLLGEHDFGAFGRPPIEGGGTVRTLQRADWRQQGDTLRFEIEGNAFLQHMVRKVVAALVAVGTGQLEAPEVLGLLDRPDERWVGGIAPARGLCLEHVQYEGEFEEDREQTGLRENPQGGNQ